MRIFPLLALGLVMSNVSVAGIVPDDYRARIINEVVATRDFANEGSYDIVFSAPAYVTARKGANGASNGIQGAVRFRVTWVPPLTKNTIYNGGSFPEVAVFDKSGHPTLMGDVDWLWEAPKLDEAKKMAVDLPRQRAPK
jgi:hypothetical protein